ncbi:MAG: hypothetical protein AAGG66_08370 [Methanothrix soehngenii]|mgnify:FL=1|jgi:hypothetical protein|uniref:Uncharacterized protein n=4 Tax=root TaxID=1 RepID=A0A0W8F6X6_9ZZZZ|nr:MULTISPECIES: hypothetical protein [Methanothrix]MDQ1312299.1 hypothetical protein [Euryarchaeota archaeon]MCK9405412.1 hypothetical protein [Methanothrix sp.]MDY0410799.1 hypothetical protein [Methanothrix soehngenii]UEC41210.1 MAG: hypothetical protein METHSR3v1_1930014 [Methanothrix sp.]HNY35193.1 hypothetical protein [Methanothrix soehngenii]
MMKHPDRVFSFKELESEDDLVEAMTNHHWPICYGFYYSNHLYLGDGDSESDPEYAVTTVDKTEGHHGVHGREVGRIKPKGMSADQVRTFIQEITEGNYTSENPVRVEVEPIWHHSCTFCRLEED